MKNLKISIPEMGNREGTLNWVAEQLSDTTFKVAPNKFNVPCVWYKLKYGKKFHILVKPHQNETAEQDWMFYREYGNLYIEHATNKDNHVWGMFSFLTPAAKTYVNEFIEEVADEFERYIEEDKEKECTVSVNIS